MSYLEKHKASGLKVGDRVRVLRAAENEEGGWDNTWVMEMDEYVEVGGVITEDFAEAGFYVKFGAGESWGFPYFVLEKVEE